jgi:hypothetical protein
MNFSSLIIDDGSSQEEFLFSPSANLIYSKKNSVGKTTLLRFLIYSLGYHIPSTRGLDFNKYILFLKLKNDKNRDITLVRNKLSIVYRDQDEKINYFLPSDLFELHSHVFGIENREVLDNLLGAFYADQEKGWTLLNRGTVIGSIRFSIEDFLMGLSNRYDSKLSDRLNTVKRELQKYRQMLDIAKYQAEIRALGENIAFDASAEEIESAIDSLYCERKPFMNEFERIKNVIRENRDFKKYISSMKLRVLSAYGEEVPVNESTLIGFRDNNNYLITKLHLIETEIAKIDRKIDALYKRQNKESTLFDIQTMIQAFDVDISKIRIDVKTANDIVSTLEKESNELKKKMMDKLKVNNPIIGELHALIFNYAQEIGISEKYVRRTTDYIFTSDLKSLTGAIFHKIVFIFKISYIKIIKKYANVKLPIIMDSPSGRELDKINITDMIKILVRDFMDHQIIIASINEYNIPNVEKIEISERLLQ